MFCLNRKTYVDGFFVGYDYLEEVMLVFVMVWREDAYDYSVLNVLIYFLDYCKLTILTSMDEYSLYFLEVDIPNKLLLFAKWRKMNV